MKVYDENGVFITRAERKQIKQDNIAIMITAGVILALLVLAFVFNIPVFI